MADDRSDQEEEEDRFSYVIHDVFTGGQIPGELFTLVCPSSFPPPKPLSHILIASPNLILWKRLTFFSNPVPFPPLLSPTLAGVAPTGRA